MIPSTDGPTVRICRIAQAPLEISRQALSATSSGLIGPSAPVAGDAHQNHLEVALDGNDHRPRRATLVVTQEEHGTTTPFGCSGAMGLSLSIDIYIRTTPRNESAGRKQSSSRSRGRPRTCPLPDQRDANIHYKNPRWATWLPSRSLHLYLRYDAHRDAVVIIIGVKSVVVACCACLEGEQAAFFKRWSSRTRRSVAISTTKKGSRFQQPGSGASILQRIASPSALDCPSVPKRTPPSISKKDAWYMVVAGMKPSRSVPRHHPIRSCDLQNACVSRQIDSVHCC